MEKHSGFFFILSLYCRWKTFYFISSLVKTSIYLFKIWWMLWLPVSLHRNIWGFACILSLLFLLSSRNLKKVELLVKEAKVSSVSSVFVFTCGCFIGINKIWLCFEKWLWTLPKCLTALVVNCQFPHNWYFFFFTPVILSDRSFLIFLCVCNSCS